MPITITLNTFIALKNEKIVIDDEMKNLISKQFPYAISLTHYLNFVCQYTLVFQLNFSSVNKLMLSEEVLV